MRKEKLLGQEFSVYEAAELTRLSYDPQTTELTVSIDLPDDVRDYDVVQFVKGDKLLWITVHQLRDMAFPLKRTVKLPQALLPFPIGDGNFKIVGDDPVSRGLEMTMDVREYEKLFKPTKHAEATVIPNKDFSNFATGLLRQYLPKQ